jgi:O-antigen ligase
MNEDKPWAYAMVGLCSLQLLIGALINWQPTLEYVPFVAGCIMLIASLWRLRNGLPSKSALCASTILIAAVSIAALQLVQVPPSIWTSLPGRQFVLTALTATDQKPGWMAISLAPHETINYLIYSIPAIALFFASLSLDPKDRKTVFSAFVLFAVVSSLLGLVQKSASTGHFLKFFEDPGSMGFFANHNFHGALLYASIPAMAALSLGELANRSAHNVVAALFAVTFLIIVLIGIGSTASRAAIILAMLGVFLSTAMLWRRNQLDQKKFQFSLKLGAFVIILFAAAQFGLAGLSRLAETDKLADGRAIMAAGSFTALKEFFPIGSGFGSFVPVYAMGEEPDMMLSGYINHAHNDWIELVLEGGLPIAAAMVAFLLWLVSSTYSAWRNRAATTGDYVVRASAIIIFLLLSHSFSDYPLRTRGLMALFAVCCGFLACGPQVKLARSMRRASPSPRPNPSITTIDFNQRSEHTNERKSYFIPKKSPPDEPNS